MPRHIAVLFLFCFSSNTFASPIYFDFRSAVIEDIDGASSLTLFQNLITLTATTAEGVFNRTSNGFGVNASGAGDDTDALDGGSGVFESILFSFDHAVTIHGFNVSAFGNQDRGSYRFNLSPTIEFFQSGFNAINDQSLTAGETFGIQFISGNGFSFDQLSVSKISVPEPHTWLLIATGFGLLRVSQIRRLIAGNTA